MFTNQKFLGFILILFIIGAASYFTYSKFKQEISDASSSPSPSLNPSGLTFLFNTSQPSPQSTANQPAQENVNNARPQGQKLGPQQASPQAQVAERPLKKIKKISAFPGLIPEDVRINKKVVIKTAKGIIQIRIYPEVPQTSSNFLLLAANGFYDGLKFHRVESNFVVQGGDPNGDGSGGPGYTFTDEPINREYTKGTVAMANSGPNANGSQFFILLADHPELPKKYTIFGAVIEGMDVMEKIAVGDVMEKVVVQNL